MAKETWDTSDLNRLNHFLQELQDHLQQSEVDWDVKVVDLALNLNSAVRRHEQRLGLVTLHNGGGTTLQFKVGDYEIGLG